MSPEQAQKLMPDNKVRCPNTSFLFVLQTGLLVSLQKCPRQEHSPMDYNIIFRAGVIGLPHILHGWLITLCLSNHLATHFASLQAKSGPLDLETGKAATVSTGRPNLHRLIAEAVTEHPQENFIGVIASGSHLRFIIPSKSKSGTNPSLSSLQADNVSFTAFARNCLPRYHLIPTFVGPPSLVVDAREATHKASRTARKLGLRGIPEVAFSNHSFTL